MRAAASTHGTTSLNKDLLNPVGNYGNWPTHCGAMTIIIFTNPSPATWLHPVSRQRRKWPVYADCANQLYTIEDSPSAPRNQQRYSVHKWKLNIHGQPDTIPYDSKKDMIPFTTIIPDMIAIPVTIKLNKRNQPTLAFTQNTILRRLYQSTLLPSTAAVQEDFHT
jgi:hypothetical protein